MESASVLGAATAESVTPLISTVACELSDPLECSRRTPNRSPGCRLGKSAFSAPPAKSAGPKSCQADADPPAGPAVTAARERPPGIASTRTPAAEPGMMTCVPRTTTASPTAPVSKSTSCTLYEAAPKTLSQKTSTPAGVAAARTFAGRSEPAHAAAKRHKHARDRTRGVSHDGQPPTERKLPRPKLKLPCPEFPTQPSDRSPGRRRRRSVFAPAACACRSPTPPPISATARGAAAPAPRCWG
jgi:hypothetical protein